VKHNMADKGKPKRAWAELHSNSCDMDMCVMASLRWLRCLRAVVVVVVSVCEQFVTPAYLCVFTGLEVLSI